MPSSSSSSTVMSNSSSRSITIWTRSRLSASRSSAKLDSSVISSTGLLRLSAAVLRNRSNSSSVISLMLLWVGDSVAHRQAAVDGDDGTGDVGRLVRGEKAYGGGHLGGSPEAADRDLTGHAFAPVVAERSRHVGLDRARGDDIGGDPTAAVFPGDRASEPDEASLAGGVVGLARRAQVGADGRDEHEATPAGFHHRTDRAAGDVERTGEVGVDDVVPVV